MNGTAQYVQLGFILISVANLIVIALLIVVFALAVALRRPEKQRLSTIDALPTPVGTLPAPVDDSREAEKRVATVPEVLL